MRCSRKLTRRFAPYLLLALASRSLVASGWMLVLPNGSGPLFPTFVVCPQQSPELAQWLTPKAHPHHHGLHDSGGSGASFSVLDPGCAMWAGSAIATLADAVVFAPIENDPARIGPRYDRPVAADPPCYHNARAPPVVLA